MANLLRKVESSCEVDRVPQGMNTIPRALQRREASSLLGADGISGKNRVPFGNKAAAFVQYSSR